jgi:hypothetical protein
MKWIFIIIFILTATIALARMDINIKLGLEDDSSGGGGSSTAITNPAGQSITNPAGQEIVGP